MSMQSSIKTCFAKYATFTGVASRPEYWWFNLFYYIVYLISLVVFKSPGLTLLWSLGAFLPLLSAGVRRLHDTGRSGWWWLLPIVNLIFMCQASKTDGNKYLYGMQNVDIVQTGLYCANCGNRLNGDESFCKNCGAKIEISFR